MNWSKFKLKKVYTEYEITNSCYFNDKHEASTYLNVIEQILNHYDFLDGRKLSGYEMTRDYFTTVVFMTNRHVDQIECEIDFKTTTLTIAIKE